MIQFRFAAIVVMAALFTAGACKGEKAAPAKYTARGMVKNITKADGKDTLLIHHEAIPDFVNQKGKKVGMGSMSMPFGIDTGVALDGIAKEDKVEFTFAVDWERFPPQYITRMSKLPASAELKLSGM